MPLSRVTGKSLWELSVVVGKSPSEYGPTIREIDGSRIQLPLVSNVKISRPKLS